MSEKSMRKKHLEDYKLVVFDLDGTLYFQKPFRIRMLTYLIGYTLSHPSAIKDILIVKKYREVREKWDVIESQKGYLNENGTEELTLDKQQYEYVANKMKTSPEKVESAITFFMHEAPLSLLPKYRDEKLAEKIEELKQKNVTVAIYSDYPVKDKLKALGIEVKHQYTSSDERINSLKPNPVGLQVIQNDLGVQPEEICMVGDRMEKDGEAAKANGIDYLILSSKKQKRQY